VTRQGSFVDEPHQPDHRFTLANERTLLAWVRTALALDVAGLGIIRFAPEVGPTGGRAISAILGYSRWAATDRALRTGSPLPPSGALKLLAYSLTALSLATVALIIGRALVL
jgi:putative membrane protein